MPSKQQLIRSLGHVRRRTFEAIGSHRFSRTGAEDIDRKLERHLDLDRGFFVEAGANDGVNFSNTYYLERARGWTGVLVEGIPDLYAACVRHRPGAHVVNCALVAPEDQGEPVTMHYSNLQSIVAGALPYDHVQQGLVSQDERTYVVQVPGRTLTSVLDEVAPERFDLLVLDVEGYEAQVLRGLDLERYAPRFALIEVLDDARRAAVEEVLGERYAEVDRFTPTDVLYAARP